MVKRRDIQRVVDQIVEKFDPDKVILFGSYAYGRPTDDSDIDLLVVMPHEGRPLTKSIEILHAIDYHFPLDLIVRRQEDIDRRIPLGDWFLEEITEKGKPLYERTRARVAGTGRRRLRFRHAAPAGTKKTKAPQRRVLRATGR
jgi:predicted nucleotidyltransferase